VARACNNHSVHARFYAPDAQEIGQIVGLSDEEAAHATRVLRLQTGDAVRVFDGRGHEFAGAILHVAKDAVTVRLDATHEAATERRVRVTLAQAVLKGDRMDDVVRDAVMMGVTAIVPLVTGRTEVSPAALQRGRRHERWARIAIVSAKQCGRAVVPSIEEPCDLTAFCQRLRADGSNGFICVEPSVHPGPDFPRRRNGGGLAGARRPAAVSPGRTEPPDASVVLVGPEGGWTPEEVEQAAAVAVPMTLPGPTLRADAMPIVALSVLFERWGEFS
jgi:16S rRNA (uracil1498-N3)-methyltransferase